MSECIDLKFKQLMYALQIFKELSHNDICLGVCDREKYHKIRNGLSIWK